MGNKRRPKKAAKQVAAPIKATGVKKIWTAFEEFFFDRWIAIVIALLSIVLAYELNMRGVHLILLASEAIIFACLFHANGIRDMLILWRLLTTLCVGSFCSFVLYYFFWNFSQADENMPSIFVDSIIPENVSSNSDNPGGIVRLANNGRQTVQVITWGGVMLGGPALTKLPDFLRYGEGLGPDIIPSGSIKDLFVSTHQELGPYWAKIQNGEMLLYYWLAVKYRNAIADSNSKVYEYTLFAVYDPKTGMFMDTPFGNDVREVDSMKMPSNIEKSPSLP